MMGSKLLLVVGGSQMGRPNSGVWPDIAARAYAVKAYFHLLGVYFKTCFINSLRG